VKVLFNGEVDVHYGFINVHHVLRDHDWEIGGEYRGQANGLCGAAIPGLLSLVTGLHTGEVGFTVELHGAEPSLDDAWEEIVEVSFTAAKKKMGLHGFQSQYEFRLPKGDYRVRYCARGMDEGRDEDTLGDGGPVDFYLLQFWPGTVGPDCILRQTSAAAAYWHRAHRGRPLPPAEQQAEERLLAGEQEDYFRSKFGGRFPNARLRALDSYLTGMLLIDRDLLMTLSEIGDDEVLRNIARWSALRALTVAGLADHPKVSAATSALRAREPIPAPFDDELGWYSMADKVKRLTHVPHLPGFRFAEDEEEPIQQWNALGSLTSVSEADALQAAIGALESAAVAHGAEHYAGLLNDLRTEFPALGPVPLGDGLT
jgi:hypothetical protein